MKKTTLQRYTRQERLSSILSLILVNQMSINSKKILIGYKESFKLRYFVKSSP